MYEIVITTTRPNLDNFNGDQFEQEIRESHPELNIPWRGVVIRDNNVLSVIVEDDAPDDETLEALSDSIRNLEENHSRKKIVQPLDSIGVFATLNAVLGVWPLEDSAKAVHLEEEDLINEALAWSLPD